MMPAFWKPEDCHIHIGAEANLAPTLPDWVATKVFRQDLTQPGFACLSLSGQVDSFQLRRTMAWLKEQLSNIFQTDHGQTLAYYSLGRFDQKKTTRLHLDGGPTCSFLMLGYEPSAVTSRFLISDYSRCAADLGLSPHEFLEHQNPMFTQEGREALQPYTQALPRWHDGQNRIVILNNSSLPASSPLPGLGILHGAEVLNIPSPGTPRIINSTLFVPQPEAPAETAEALKTFLETDAISGQIL